MNSRATDPRMIEALEGASSLQLYQLKSFIEGLLADPRRGMAARTSLHLGQAVSTDFGGSFIGFGKAQSEQLREALLRLPCAPEPQAHFALLASQSVEEQKRIEAADTVPFEAFRRAYLDTQRLGV